MAGSQAVLARLAEERAVLASQHQLEAEAAAQRTLQYCRQHARAVQDLQQATALAAMLPAADRPEELAVLHRLLTAAPPPASRGAAPKPATQPARRAAHDSPSISEDVVSAAASSHPHSAGSTSISENVRGASALSASGRSESGSVSVSDNIRGASALSASGRSAAARSASSAHSVTMSGRVTSPNALSESVAEELQDYSSDFVSSAARTSGRAGTTSPAALSYSRPSSSVAEDVASGSGVGVAVHTASGESVIGSLRPGHAAHTPLPSQTPIPDVPLSDFPSVAPGPNPAKPRGGRVTASRATDADDLVTLEEPPSHTDTPEVVRRVAQASASLEQRLMDRQTHIAERRAQLRGVIERQRKVCCCCCC